MHRNPGFSISDAHRQAAGRQRRIIVQYDAKETFDMAISDWMDHYLAYLDEPGHP